MVARTRTAPKPRPPREHPWLISLAVAGERYDLSPRTIRNHIATGRLRAYRLGPRLLKIDVREADRVYLRPLSTVRDDGAA